MDFQYMMEQIGLARQGIDSFNDIHSRCADPAFVKRLEQNFAAYDQGLDVFSPDLEAFAEELGIRQIRTGKAKSRILTVY